MVTEAVMIKSMVKRAIPPALLNRVLLTFPALYRTRLVNYETNLTVAGQEDLLEAVEAVLRLQGDIIECGSSRCGGSILMAHYMRSRGVMKRIYACDSFQGFEPAELQREREAGLTDTPDGAFTSTSLAYVVKKLHRLGLTQVITPVKGFFNTTLPQFAGHSFCLAFVDCDLEHSVRYCADTLWPALPSGGLLVFDDYTEAEYRGARLGIESFVAAHLDEMASHGLRRSLYVVRKR